MRRFAWCWLPLCAPAFSGCAVDEAHRVDDVPLAPMNDVEDDAVDAVVDDSPRDAARESPATALPVHPREEAVSRLPTSLPVVPDELATAPALRFRRARAGRIELLSEPHGVTTFVLRQREAVVSLDVTKHRGAPDAATPAQAPTRHRTFVGARATAGAQVVFDLTATDRVEPSRGGEFASQALRLVCQQEWISVAPPFALLGVRAGLPADDDEGECATTYVWVTSPERQVSALVCRTSPTDAGLAFAAEPVEQIAIEDDCDGNGAGFRFYRDIDVLAPLVAPSTAHPNGY